MFSSNRSGLSLKVVINKQKSKVLFAEANSDVVDVLFSILTLPLGKLVGLLEELDGGDAPVIGSLTTLHSGLVNLDSSHFCIPGAKRMLLNPASSFQRQWSRLKLDISDSQLRNLYFCEDEECSNSEASNVSIYSDIANCDCGRPLNRPKLVTDLVHDGDGGVFMIKAASFIICDDLRVVPVDSDFLRTLDNLGITDTAGAEMDALSIDIDDVMSLLKHSLISSTPLTDFVFKKAQKSSTAAKPQSAHFSHQTRNEEAHSRNMLLKVFFQKETNRFLFAVATDEFVEFLFGFLALPLAGVEFILGGETCLKNVDNLYKSVTDLIEDKYFRSSAVKNKLMNPKLPHNYVSKNQFLPLSEEGAPELTMNGKPLTFKSMKGERSFMKEQTVYIVSDDLTVKPFSLTSGFLIPSSLGISLSEVKQNDLQIGVEEALGILKASLTSTTPLTHVLGLRETSTQVMYDLMKFIMFGYCLFIVHKVSNESKIRSTFSCQDQCL